ncbi:MAG: sulfatase-like hydrolase/transferase [Propionibacteriaceae bacterium]|nr:sulfatase-like hydrolase/transferase [Propionibacteriaceae bacterium]
MVLDLDASMGRVLQALEDAGAADNTVVLFFSDNGGERFSYQWPLSGQKFSLLEGGIRVPTILRWPRHIGPGQTSATPVVTMDWTATLLAWAGSPPPAGAYALDGTDLTGHLLREESLPERELFWRVRHERALRRGDWKYYATETAQGWTERLFDLSRDLREQADLSQHHPELLDELRRAWSDTADALLPYN